MGGKSIHYKTLEYQALTYLRPNEGVVTAYTAESESPYIGVEDVIGGDSYVKRNNDGEEKETHKNA